VTTVRASDLEPYVRAALASTATCLAGGVVAAQYVGSGLYGYAAPAVLGVLTGAAAQAAARGPRAGPGASRIRVLAAAYAVLGVGLGFVLERSQGVFEPASAGPYACAVAGVLLWTLGPRGGRGAGST
jgi:hypothetical protein